MINCDNKLHTGFGFSNTALHIQNFESQLGIHFPVPTTI